MKVPHRPWPMTTTSERGRWAENLACTYLCEHGLQLVARNYRCQFGEIDLIMQHGVYLVFVEVRYRAYQRYGGGLESIDYRKQQRLVLAATHYLQTHPDAQHRACRFDAMIVSGQSQMQWVIDAFQA